MDIEELNKQIHTQSVLIKQLQETIKMKDKCLSIISHDFQGVSRNLAWVVDALDEGSISFDIFRSLIPELKSSISINQKTINLISNWVDSQDKRFAPVKRQILLNDFFQSLRDFHLINAQKKRVDLVFGVDNLDYVFYNDEVIVNFILNIFIENAIKYSFEGGKVSVHASVDNGQLTFNVEDNGVGMSKDVLDRLFILDGSPYTGTQNEKGAGLGIVIANDFAQRIDGRIIAHSTENKGTVIKLILPGAS